MHGAKRRRRNLQPPWGDATRRLRSAYVTWALEKSVMMAVQRRSCGPRAGRLEMSCLFRVFDRHVRSMGGASGQWAAAR